MAELCSTGCWIDKVTGQVVTEEPVEGRLLVAPGGALTPDVNATIERARAAAPVAAETAAVVEVDSEDASAPEAASEDATAPQARETASTPTSRKRGA